MNLSNSEVHMIQTGSRDVSAPVLLNYVSWILHIAQERKIHTLYFLARDGYILKEIASLIVEKEGIDIECKYLYCSRVSLRTPTYHLIGEEAYDILLLGGYNVTPYSVLKRVPTSPEWYEKVLTDMNIPTERWNSTLSRKELEEFSYALRHNEMYRAGVTDVSRKAYDAAVNYLKQEGLLDCDTVAVVDSGWTGSMQRSLRQLLESIGFKGKLVGFYFGMFAHQKSKCDGEYLTWYFDNEKHLNNKILFSNNLFECILSAPHGMTLGYEKNEKDVYQPILATSGDGDLHELITTQADAILQSTQDVLKQYRYQDFDANNALKESQKILRRFMARPTRDEVQAYGCFDFSDDVREDGLLPLASKEQVAQIKNYSMIKRVFRRIFKIKVTQGELFWPYGTLAFLSGVKQEWYRLNIMAWEYVKYKNNRVKILSTKNQDISEYKKLVDQYDVVSFDIFDTLLYRLVQSPTDVFTLMEPFAKSSCNIELFHDKRIKAEQDARKHSSAEDVTLEEIYAEFKKPKEIIEQLISCENKTELSQLKRDNTMAELLNYCVASGKKVLIVSDMYQSSSFLNEALKNAGISGYTSLYVSSEVGKTKASGTLYTYVADKEKITDLKKWIHFGDNVNSDGNKAKMAGIKSVIYDNGRGLLMPYRSKLRIILGKIKRKIKGVIK